MTQAAQIESIKSQPEDTEYDFSYVKGAARIAVYDDLLSVPHVIEIPPAPTTDFIGALSAEIYNQAQSIGGGIPFTAIRQVTENFIHARFQEIVVSILDKGNTIRFADQGPGIKDKERAQQPGFSSATAPMKKFIEGVGSGLPIVREYLDVKHGYLKIEDNLNGGAVVTLTLMSQSEDAGVSAPLQTTTSDIANSNSKLASRSDTVADDKLARSISIGLSKRGRNILTLFSQEDLWGVQDISETLGYPLSSTHTELKKLEEAGLIERIGKKRIISPIGHQVISFLD